MKYNAYSFKHYYFTLLKLNSVFFSPVNLNKIFGPKKYCDPATFYWGACSRPGKWAVMYLCVRGIDFAFYTNFLFDFGSDLTVWYVLFFAVHFSITILLYDSISGKSIGLCNYIPSCLLNLSECDQIIKKIKKTNIEY